MLGSRVATTQGRIRVARSWTEKVRQNRVLYMIDQRPYDWWCKSGSMLIVMWRLMRVALSKHLLNVSQGGWRQSGRCQCWGSPVAVAAGVAIAHPWVASAIGAIGARQDIKAGLWSARGSQLHHRSLNEIELMRESLVDYL